MMAGTWNPGSKLYQLRNPLALRGSQYSNELDPDGYCRFRDLAHGYLAGGHWLRQECVGAGPYALNGESTLFDLCSRIPFPPRALDFADCATYCAEWLSVATGKLYRPSSKLELIFPCAAPAQDAHRGE